MTCLRSDLRGDLVNWTNSTWKLNNATSGEIDIAAEVCSEPRRRDVLFLERRTMTHHGQFCAKLRGNITVVADKGHMAELIKEFQGGDLSRGQFGRMSVLLGRGLNQQIQIESRFWAGWNDERAEGNYTEPVGGKVLPAESSLWFPGEPNGDRMENCAVVWAERAAWNDIMCERPTPGFCFIHTRPSFKLRGAELRTHHVVL